MCTSCRSRSEVILGGCPSVQVPGSTLRAVACGISLSVADLLCENARRVYPQAISETETAPAIDRGEGGIEGGGQSEVRG